MSVSRGRIVDRRKGFHRWLRPDVEGLETRALLSVSVSEAPGQISSTTSNIYSSESLGRFVVGPDGNEWLADNTQGIGQAGTVDRLTSAGVLTRFQPAASGNVVDITVGSDNNLWALVEADSNIPTAGHPDQITLSVAKITTDGAVTTYAVPGVLATLDDQNTDRPPTPRITAGGDRRLWFTDGFNIGRIDGSGSINLYPTGASEPAGAITSGSDGNLWFTNGGSLSPSYSSFTPPGVTDQSVGAIGRISVSGVVTEFPAGALPTPSHESLQPSSIVSGPGNFLWFTDGATIGRAGIDGTIVAYQGPQAGGAEDITVGPDGELWFTVAPPHGYGSAVEPTGATGYFPVLGRLDASNKGQLTEVGLPATAYTVGIGANGDLTAVGQNNTGPTGSPDVNGNFSTGSGIYDVSLNSADAAVSIHPRLTALTGLADQAGLVATFTDGFAYAPASAFSAVVDGSTAYIQADPSGGFDVYATGTIGDGTEPLALTIYDRVTPGYLGSTTVAIPVVSHLQPLLTSNPIGGTASGRVSVTGTSGINGAGMTQVLARFISATEISSATSFTGSIDWGDGSSPTTGIVATSGSQSANMDNGSTEAVYTFTASHAYPSSASYYVVRAMLQDAQGNSVFASNLIAVKAPSLSIQAVPVVIGSSLSLTNAVLATFSVPYDTSGSGDTSFAATLNWNDGTSPGTAAIVQRYGSVFEVRGSHTFARAGGYVVSIAISQSGQPATSLITTAITPEPAIATYLNNAYTLVLGHGADASTIATLTPQLETGLVPLSQFAASLVNSPQAVADRVTSIFTTIYGQGPDAATVAQVSASFNAGLTDESARSFLYGSAQYYAKEGGTDTKFLQGLYLGVLGRTIDSGALYGYLAMLQAGTITRTQIAFTTLTSAEAYQDLVIQDYQAVLGRSPSMAELSNGVSSLQSGGTDESIKIMLVGSGEYFGKA